MKTTTDLIFTPPTVGTIYGLLASDEPMQIRYVGQTTRAPILRLAGHITCLKIVLPSQKWVASVKARGVEIRMRILGEYPLNLLDYAEHHWILFWSQYCELTNRVGMRDYRPQDQGKRNQAQGCVKITH